MAASPQDVAASLKAPKAPMPQGPSPVDGAPGAAPMLTPQQPVGEQAAAKVQVLTAQKVLVQSMQAFQPGSSEFKAIMNAIKALTGAFGKDEEKQEELQPADVKNMLQTLAGPGQGAPGGGPPPGGPPGAAPAPPGPGGPPPMG